MSCVGIGGTSIGDPSSKSVVIHESFLILEGDVSWTELPLPQEGTCGDSRG